MYYVVCVDIRISAIVFRVNFLVFVAVVIFVAVIVVFVTGVIVFVTVAVVVAVIVATAVVAVVVAVAVAVVAIVIAVVVVVVVIAIVGVIIVVIIIVIIFTSLLSSSLSCKERKVNFDDGERSHLRPERSSCGIRRMLWLYEKENHRRRIRIYLVVCNRRPEIIIGSDDFESSVRKRGNCTGSTANGHWSGTMQNHES